MLIVSLLQLLKQCKALQNYTDSSYHTNTFSALISCVAVVFVVDCSFVVVSESTRFVDVVFKDLVSVVEVLDVNVDVFATLVETVDVVEISVVVI